ncbi:MAG: hypothetical protein HYZ81_19600 [Nitrospinae bacterium]|nr:hypothetical protein [Nitrospinota bacterium]
MTNLGYILAAYLITLGALAGYALLVWGRLRGAEREVTALLAAGERGHGRQ